MKNVLQHRGPDDYGYFEDNNISIGNTRLSIIDVKGGKQPIMNENDDMSIVFSGEIYNHIELRNALIKKGHRFKTNSDTEVVLHLYEEYGQNSVEKLNGMFAFAIWDSNSKELFLCRDRFGIKPLYYYYDKEKFIFASELKAILEHPVQKNINFQSVSNFLSLRYNPTKFTVLNNILKMMPGYCLTLKHSEININKYYELKHSTKQENIFSLLDDSVKSHLQSEVPVGVYLSGGIDSGAILALASKYNENLSSFTLGFNQKTDENKQAREVAEHFDSEHHDVYIGEDSLNKSKEIFFHADEPLGDPTIVPSYYLSKKAGEKVKVVLSGEGADEIYGGYEQYKILNTFNTMKKIIPKVPTSTTDGTFVDFLSKSYNSSGSKQFSELTNIFSESEKQKLMINYLKSNISYPPSKIQHAMQKFDFSHFLPQLLMKFDKMTMAHSVEGRVPFLDHRIVENAFSQTHKASYIVQEKQHLRKAMRNIMPNNFTNNKKQRFFSPIDNWYSTIKFQLNHSIETNKFDSFFDIKKVNQLLEYKKFRDYKLMKFHDKAKLFYARKVWNIYSFCKWHENFME